MTCWEWAGSTCSPSTSRRPSSSVLQSGTTLGQGQLSSHHHICINQTESKITLVKTLHISRFLQGSYPNSDVERLQTQCFKSVWVATALHQVRKGKRKILIKKPCGADHTFQPQGLTFPLNYGHLTAAPNTVHGEVDDQMQPKTQFFT